MWRSGLCDWCRGCMPMHGAVSVLVRGIVKSLNWRSVFNKAQYSARCSSSLCLKLCQAFRSGVPWEDLHADDLVIIAELLKECVRRLLTWKEEMEEKRLRVNAGNTKICGTGLDLLQSSGEFPCAVCCTGVGSNSIFCNCCKYWVNKKCSGLKHLTKDFEYRCTWCQGTACPLDGRSQREAQVRPYKLEVVADFCYQRDMLPAAGGCELSTTTHVKSWRSCYQFSLSATSLWRHMAACTALVCGAHASCQWDLAIDNAKPPAEKWQGNDQTYLQCHAARHCHYWIQWDNCVAWYWGSGPHSEGEKALLVWTCGMLQWCSQVSLWPTGWWKAWAWEANDDMEAADREGLQRVEALGCRPSWPSW